VIGDESMGAIREIKERQVFGSRENLTAEEE
jgi:hypothetical protein